MSKIAPMISCCSALTLCFVLLTVSVSAQTTPTTSPLPTAEATAGPTTPTQPDVTGQTPYGVPNAGMQPGMMGGPMTGGMTGGAMPGGMSGMYGMGARPGAYGGAMGGVDPEMQAFLNNRLQNLRSAETQINNDITMAGGEASPAARQLIMQRAQLQGQIRELEQQVGTSPMGATGMGTAAMGTAGMPGAATNPMTEMQPGAMGTGMPNNMGAAYATPGMGNAYGAYGMPDMGMGMGTSPNTMMLEQLKQEAVFNLRDLQRTLSLIPPNDPIREQLQSEQARLLEQIESLNKQMGQSGTNATTPGTTGPDVASGMMSPNAAGTGGSLAASLEADRLAQQAQQEAARQMAIQQSGMRGAADPRLIQMREAERQLRAMGEIEAADSLLRQIEERQRDATGGFVEPQMPGGIMPSRPPMPPLESFMDGMPTRAATQPTTTDIVRQAEILELRNTVESLRGEIASMREEIRSLETLLRQANPMPPGGMIPTLPETTNIPNGTTELPPAMVD